VSERASPKTWTADVQMKDGRLPELKSWARTFRDHVGEAFVLRGVEVTVDGVLAEDDGRLGLRVSGGDAVLRLAALEGKVQWDVAGKREEPASEAERDAYKNLGVTWKGKPRRVRLTGPLREADKGGVLILHVREYADRP